MLSGKTYKVIVDRNDDVKGVYVRDLPAMLATVMSEITAEWLTENKKNLRWFAGGMAVMAVAWMTI